MLYVCSGHSADLRGNDSWSEREYVRLVAGVDEDAISRGRLRQSGIKSEPVD